MATISNQTSAAKGPVFQLSRNLHVRLRRSICLLAAGVLMAMKAHVAEDVSPRTGDMRPAPLPHGGISASEAPVAVPVTAVSNLSPDGSWCWKYYRRLL